MDSRGGFLIDKNALQDSGKDAQTAANKRAREEANASEQSTSIDVRKLTQKQEVRLMDYLDDAFLQLSRNFAKRYTAPESSNVPTLNAYLVQIERILAIVAAIPPVGPSAQLLVNYLLRLTSDVCDGIQGYTLDRPEDAISAQEKQDVLAKQLDTVVQTLSLFDRVWGAVLRGQMVSMQGARRHVQEESHENIMVLSKEGAVNDASDFRTSFGRYPADDRPATKSDGRQVIGSKGFATVGQTHRIRLRNIITLSKENLFTWMRLQLDAPLPPQIEQSEQEKEAERKEQIGIDGDIDQPDELADAEQRADVENGKESNEDEIALEDVTLERNVSGGGGGENSEEKRHYDSLFSRTVDPDASDDEEEAADGGLRPESSSLSGTHSPPGGEDPRSSKRLRRDERDDFAQRGTSMDRETLVEPTEAESEATLMGAHGPAALAVMRWDVAFAHLFSRSLRCLSDIQEYYEQKTSSSNAAAAHANSGKSYLSASLEAQGVNETDQ